MLVFAKDKMIQQSYTAFAINLHVQPVTIIITGSVNPFS